MMQLVCIMFLLLPLIQAQFDPQWCPDGPTPPTVDPRWTTIPTRFEILVELVSNNEVIEISQAFSTTRDSIAKNFATTPTMFYWDFTTDEYFKILTTNGVQQRRPECTREVITSDSQTSVIEPDTLYLKPSIILGFNPRNEQDPLWGLSYDSDGVLRNIPTNIFKSCFYVSDINATVQVTYHVSDFTKFQAYLPVNESLILQFDVNMTTTLGRQQAYTYNVFYYIPNPGRRRERQALETPSGVYCLNRTLGKSVPSNIPDRVSANSEIFLPTYNNSIVSSHNLYDIEYQFSRFDVWYPTPRGGSEWQHRTEMHDFAVGLSYRYNHQNRRCSVSDISENTTDAVPADGTSNLFQMSAAQHIFLMDDITYQYTGEKRCRDRVWCNVWIGENELPNNTVEHREWYWATRINNQDLSQWIPMKLIIKRYVSDVLNFSSEMNLFNYRLNPMTIFEIDYTLADCYRALGPAQNFNYGVLSFKIANDRKYPVFQNLNYLRLHIWETLTFTLFIRPIRISNVIVDQDDTDILVTFTLLDAPPRTGPVEVPLIEPSLDTLIERLTNIIDANGLTFRAKSGTKPIVLRARANSLNIDHKSKEEKTRSSGPRITALWIGCTVGGLLIGGVISFFVFERLAKK